MQQTATDWTLEEKKVAEEAFERAYTREIEALISEVRTKSGLINEVKDLWKLHDFLSARRHEIDGKYDYDYSSLLFTFAELVRDEWLHLDELRSLSKEKISKIVALTKI